MANAWKHPDMLAAEAIVHLEDALIIAPLCAKDLSAEFNHTQDGYAKGDTVGIKIRPDYVATEFTPGTPVVPQDIRESRRNLVIEKHFDVSVAVGAKEKKLDLDSFVEQVIKPAAYRLAEKCDLYVGTKILQGMGLYDSAALFSTRADMALARRAANIQQLTPGGRFCLVDSDTEALLLGADWFTLDSARGATGNQIVNEGLMGRTLGMDFYTSLQFPTTTRTASSGTTTTKASPTASENIIGSSTLTVAAITGGFTAGDHIQVAGMRRPLIVATTVAAAATAIALVDQINEPVPASAAVTVIGSGTATTYRGAIFDARSLAIAMPLLDAAEDKPSYVISANGYAIRLVYGYDMALKSTALSMDLLIGAIAHDPRRITLLSDH